MAAISQRPACSTHRKSSTSSLPGYARTVPAAVGRETVPGILAWLRADRAAGLA